MKSLPAQIIKVIKNDDVGGLRALMASDPKQLTWHTPFAGETWLGYAASNGKLGSMALLVDLGADVNQGDHRENVKPICSAASNDQLEAVEFLLNRGATLDTEVSVQNPLFSAIVGRSPRIVNLLLEAGMNCSVRYNSPTMKNIDAIAFALMRGEKECARAIAFWVAGGKEVETSSILKDAAAIAEHNAHDKNA